MSTMRTGFFQAARLLCLAVLLLFPRSRASSVNLIWAPSPDAATPGAISSYKVYIGLQDFTAKNAANFSVIAMPVGLTNSVAVPNLISGLTYYFAVVSVDAAGNESDFSNVTSFMASPDVTQLPPPPGGAPITGAGPIGSTGGSSGSGSPTSDSPTTPTAVNLIGMLPRLWLYPTNGQALLAIQGTVGATFAIQSSTNPAVADSWITITNIKLSAIAPNANATPVTTLQRAFIPALEAFQDPNPVDGILRYYRIYMPLGYPILADQVLTQQGFHTRLVAVRCPGLSGYIVCYVTEESAYLDYNNSTYIVKLEASGPNIREIAAKVATTLQQNWTSASEFKVADDGTKFLFATVVQTDNPILDPPLGIPRTSSSDILIDF